MAKVLKASHYLAFIFSIFSLGIILFCLWGFLGKDHFASIPMHGDKHWYESYDDMVNRQMQDRDIFYHNIGHSIEEAKKADIIILGHSMVLFGMQNDLIQSFADKYHLRIYNMATAGDGSGEFIRRVIKRWGLHPKLWIINADDHAASFFSVSLDDFGNFGSSSAVRVVADSRLKGYLNVIGRNVSWRLQNALLRVSPEWLIKGTFLNHVSTRATLWRNIYTGNWCLDKVPVYHLPGKPITVIRDQNCHATPQEIETGLSYTNDIGGDVVLMLMPHSEFCPQRLKELASNLGYEAMIFPPKKIFTTLDQTHLDAKGAQAFTNEFLSQLEQTEAFKRVVNHLPPPTRETHFDVCFKNKEKTTLFARLMSGNSTKDITLAPAQLLRNKGNQNGILCWDDKTFHGNSCPHFLSQRSVMCSNKIV